ncbi:cytochrome c-type biogenesis protein [Nitrococcus mobilis]|nr:cytochrome c-type biogenesis protein [Nitrococcus mobilis]
MTMTRSVFTMLLFTFVMGIGGIADAASALYRFDNTSQAQRFQTLTEQLRCLVCQGESIADSNADLAKDLRSQVHEMILAGHSNEQIMQFMTERYGDFILYKPPFVPRTYFLWAGPLLLLLLASLVMIKYVGRARRDKQSIVLQQGERERLSRLLGESREPETDRTQT